jgi:hypothetical protein
MADDGYDPRFDPAFQRGFEGETALSPRQAQTAPATSASRSVISPPPGLAPAEQQAQVFSQAQGRDHGQPPARQGEGLRPRSPHVEPERDAPDRLAPAPAPLRSNPFLIAVLVLAIALIGAGVLIGSRIDLWYDDVSPDGPGFGLLNMLQFGAPLAIILGLATVIAVLVILALRWRGRPED